MTILFLMLVHYTATPVFICKDALLFTESHKGIKPLFHICVVQRITHRYINQRIKEKTSIVTFGVALVIIMLEELNICSYTRCIFK